jgi:hypothetical protein
MRVMNATTTALAPSVELNSIPETVNNSILETLRQYGRRLNAYGSFLNRMMAKAENGAITAADREAIERRARKQQHSTDRIEDLVAAHPTEAWAKAYREAGASQVA